MERWKKAIHEEGAYWSDNLKVEIEWEDIEAKYSKVFNESESRLKLTKHWKILDVGCGPTVMCRLISKGDKYGIDPLIDKFIKKNLLKMKHIQFIRCRAEEIPLKNAFDLVICRNVLDHTESPQRVIEEIATVLRKNGFLIIANYCYTPFVANLKKIVERGPFSFLKEVYHPHYFTLNDLKNLVQNRFKIVYKREIHEGKTCLDLKKPLITDKRSRFYYPSLIIIAYSLFQSLLSRELHKFRDNTFLAFWYLISLLNQLMTNHPYVKEYMLLSAKA